MFCRVRYIYVKIKIPNTFYNLSKESIRNTVSNDKGKKSSKESNSTSFSYLNRQENASFKVFIIIHVQYS